MVMTTELLDVRRIFVEPAAAELPRGKDVLARWPDAELIEIASHTQVPYEPVDVARWVRTKTEDLVIGVKKSLTARPNGRSADWIAPSTANGCAMACAYCYVPRRKGYGNPITVFANIEQITGYLSRHVARQGVKVEPNQCDPQAWVYDIGENSDCSVDARVSDNVRELVDLFRSLPTAKASFATKHVNRDLLSWDPQGRTRIRFSLMPPEEAKLLDLRTSSIDERIAAVDDFVGAGYEVHLNFSPVVVSEGWQGRWAALLSELDDRLGTATKAQLACEVIFLTHNDKLHETNLGWHPKAEELLWRPDIQQPKRSESGGRNVRYKTTWKGGWVRQLEALIGQHLPSCRIRYAF
jgi:spore photoproduct lyase family protein